MRLVREEIDGSTVIYNGCTFKIPLTGKHQIYNFATAASAINVLKQNGWNITQKSMLDGIAKLKIPARTEIVSRSPLTVVDGGHNAEGIDALYNSLVTLFKDKKIIAVFGMMKDKDYSYAVKKIAPLCERIYTTEASNPRSLDAKSLAAEVKPYCKKVKAISSPEKAYEKAVKKAKIDEVILVCGSLYLASDIKKTIG